MRHQSWCFRPAVLFVYLVAFPGWVLAGDEAVDADPLRHLEFRQIGPAAGGRHGGAQLDSRYSWLSEAAREHDGPPTQGMLEVAKELDAELAEKKGGLQSLVSEDIQRYVDAAQDLAIGHVIVPGE